MGAGMMLDGCSDDVRWVQGLCHMGAGMISDGIWEDSPSVLMICNNRVHGISTPFILNAYTALVSCYKS